MATYTTNLAMTKPEYSDTADIAVINTNMDTIDTAVNAIENSIAIVSVANTHVAITSGQYVYVRGHSTLSEGLYKATSNISANATLSTSNVSAVSGGLGADLASAASSISSLTSSLSDTDASLEAAQEGLAILADGNTHDAISSGQYVYVKNHGTLSEGLYTATTAISANATLSTSNLTAVSSGGLNALSSNIANLTTVSNPITFDANYVGNVQYNVLHKIGRLVILQLNFRVDVAIPNNTTFATINSTYAPKFITCAGLSTFDANGTTLPVRIDTSGRMYHDMYGSSMTTFYSGQIVYFV